MKHPPLLLFLPALMLLLVSCDSRPGLPSYGVVPDFILTSQDNAEFKSAEKLNGKIWIADFIFTNCSGPCPMMTSRLHRITERLKGRSDVRFVSITIDPERDRPEVLADYAKRFRADTARWWFLTGARDTLQMLNKKAFMLGDVDGSLEHSTRFVLVDQKSRIRGYYDSGDPNSLNQMLDDLGRL